MSVETAAPPAFIEKAPLERYVPPVRPSLVGMSRAELAAALGEIGVPPAQRKMRAQQLWHWLYVRGATALRRDDQRVEGAARRPRARLHPRSARGGGGAGLDRRHPQMAAAAARRSPATGRTRSSASISRETGRGTLCVSSQVGCTLNCTLLPHRHPAAGAQPHGRRDRRPDPGRPRPARRLARRGAAARRHRARPTAAGSSPTS